METMIRHLIDKIRIGKVILWVGAGFSGYAGIPSGNQLMEQLIATSGQREYLEGLQEKTLNNIAEEYVQLHGRQELLKVVKKEIDIHPADISLHLKLKEIPQINTVITTNYDKLFEIAYGESIFSIVRNTGLPMIERNKVKIFKIHGDIDNLDSIVITKSDYNNYFSYQEGQPIWNMIRSLIATHSILFIGYSIGDANIQTILGETIKYLEGNHNECFLVTPYMPEHKAEAYKRDKIQHIPMKAEELVGIIHAEITKNLLNDSVAGNIDLRTATVVLRSKGIEPTFQVNPDKTILIKSLGITNKDTALRGNIGFDFSKNPELQKDLAELLAGKHFSKVTLPGETIARLHSEISGVDIPFPDYSQNSKLILTPIPHRKFMTNLRLKDSKHVIQNVQVETYVSSHRLQVNLKHPSLNIIIEFDPQGRNPESGTVEYLDMNIKMDMADNVFDGRRISEFLSSWANGDEMWIREEKGGRYIPFLASGQGSFTDSLKKQIALTQRLYNDLMVIESFFLVSFNNLQTISEDDITKNTSNSDTY